jgi:hypothetical protein
MAVKFNLWQRVIFDGRGYLVTAMWGNTCKLEGVGVVCNSRLKAA